jgi:hypothetical protein
MAGDYGSYLHNKQLFNANGGATSDTFDALAARSGNANLHSQDVELMGVEAIFEHLTTVADEAIHAQIRLGCEVLGLSNQICSLGGYGGSPATNHGHDYIAPTWIPFYMPGPVGSAPVTADISTYAPDPTTGVYAMANFISRSAAGGEWTDHRKVWMATMLRGRYPLGKGKPDYDAEQASANVGTGGAAVDAIQVMSNAYVHSGMVNSMPDAFEAVEGVFDLAFAASFANVEPYGVLIPGYHPPLGTAVGTGYNHLMYGFPVDIQVPEGNGETIDITAFSRVALATGSAAHDVELCSTY